MTQRAKTGRWDLIEEICPFRVYARHFAPSQPSNVRTRQRASLTVYLHSQLSC